MHLIGRRDGRQTAAFGAAFVLLAALAWPSAGRAEGALAVGKPNDVAKDGVAFGYANNKATKDEAISRAIELCRTAPSSDTAQARCTLVRAYHNECLAISMDPQAGTPGAGWAIAATLEEAQQDALANCEATAGPDRQGHCELSASHCDGTPAN